MIARPYYVNLINDSLVEILGAKKFLKVVNELNYNHFIKLCQHQDWSEDNLSEIKICFKNIIKFFYNLGGLSKPITETRISKSGQTITQTIDYAQKVCEFVKQKLAGPFFPVNELDKIASYMNSDGFKTEFTKFFLQKENFIKLIFENQENDNFIANCYNQFDKIQEYHKTNKGSQRQLVPTVEHFIKYFKAQLLANNYSEQDKKLVEELTKYFYNEQTIQTALDINNERISKKIPNNILSKNLKEPILLKNLNKTIEECEKINSQFIELINEIDGYFYEWLPKDSPKNFYMSRGINCSYLEGPGGGIAEASILHPDVQNLVIKNNNAEIIGKATIYVNREQQYAVFNTFGLAKTIKKRSKNEIYNAFIRGVNDFVTQYNFENPTKKLKVVTIGMRMNDLWGQIRNNHLKSYEIYESIDYASERNQKWKYSGDSDSSQYVLYREEGASILNDIDKEKE